MFFCSPNQCYDIIIALLKCWFERVSHVTDVAHEPHVFTLLKRV